MIAAYGGDDEDEETKASLQGQDAAYCFNQYSSKPQLYLEQTGVTVDTAMQYSVSGHVAPPPPYDQQVAPQVMPQHPPPSASVSQGVQVQNGGGRPPMMLYQDVNGVTHQYQSDYGQPASVHQAYDANTPLYSPHPAAGQPVGVMSSQAPEYVQQPPVSYSGALVSATPPPPPPGPPPQQPVSQYLWGGQPQQQQLSPQQPNWDAGQKRAQYAPQQQQQLIQSTGQYAQPPPPPPPPTSQYCQVPPYLPQY